MRVPVRTSPVEGECAIKAVYCVQLSRLKLAIFLTLSIITVGIVWVASYWLPQLKRKFLYRYISIEQCTHFFVLNWDNEWTIVPRTQVNGQIAFENRHMTYIYDSLNQIFAAVQFDHIQYLVDNRSPSGVTESARNTLKGLHGSCAIDIPIPSYGRLFIDEIFHPFFLFQIFSVSSWMAQDYILFSIILLCMTVYSLVFNLYTTRSNLIKLRQMAYFEDTVYEQVVQNDNLTEIKQIKSKELVPSSLIYVNEGFKLPCDCILLRGECLVNEASLTGESLPVLKHPLDLNLKRMDKAFTLYEGTTIVQLSKGYGEHGLPCLVIRTGFSTLRGQLMRSILFPKPNRFKFFKESIQFLMMLGCFAMVGYTVTLIRLYETSDPRLEDVIFLFFNCITISIPPSLPAALSFGVNFALIKLKNAGIFCVSPPRVVVVGRIDTICFDKTGTLTQDDMEFKGVILNGNENVSDSYPVEVMDTMLCCQNLFLTKDGVVQGTAIEKQMFIKVNGQIIPNHDDRYQMEVKRDDHQFGIVRTYEFTSETQRMSVIAEQESDKKRYVFVKGAPEVIMERCIRNTVNHDVKEVVERYSQQAYRVLALAFKSLESQQIEGLKREEVESELVFLGLVLFINPLKDKTVETMNQLMNSLIDCKIVTGDNQLTALAVADQCQMIKKTNKIAILTADEENQLINLATYDSFAKFKSNQKQHSKDFQYQITYSDQSPSVDLSLNIERIDSRLNSTISSNATSQRALSLSTVYETKGNYVDEFLEYVKDSDIKITHFVLTGKVFELLYIKNNYGTLWLNKKKGVPQKLKDILMRSLIFARMKPNHKTLLVDLLQKSNRVVGMVGDGANDCGALKQADAGLALSDTEASISAPFTSKVLDISAVITLLRNGRAGLATNFQCFKFMALYSLIQYMTTIILAFQYSSLSDTEYLYSDLIIVMPISTTMALTDAYEELSVQRPSGSLFSLQCMMSVLGQVIFQTIAQISAIIILIEQDFYTGVDIKKFERIGYIENNEDVTTLFILSNFLYLSSIMAFSISKPFRKPFYTNLLFSANIFLIWLWNILMAFTKYVRLPDWDFASNTSTNWYVFIVLYGHFWMIIFYLWENLVCVRLFLWWNTRKQLKFQQLNDAAQAITDF